MNVGLFGQGDEAAQEALFLTKYAKTVYFFIKDKKLICEEDLKEAILKNEKIRLLEGRELKEIKGTEFVEKTEVLNLVENKQEEYNIDGAFLYLGTKNNTELFAPFASLDESGHIITGDNMETMVSGIYAAGDVRAKHVRQISTAIADGTIAALEGIKLLMKNKNKKD